MLEVAITIILGFLAMALAGLGFMAFLTWRFNANDRRDEVAR